MSHIMLDLPTDVKRWAENIVDRLAGAQSTSVPLLDASHRMNEAAEQFALAVDRLQNEGIRVTTEPAGGRTATEPAENRAAPKSPRPRLTADEVYELLVLFNFVEGLEGPRPGTTNLNRAQHAAQYLRGHLLGDEHQ